MPNPWPKESLQYQFDEVVRRALREMRANPAKRERVELFQELVIDLMGCLGSLLVEVGGTVGDVVEICELVRDKIAATKERIDDVLRAHGINPDDNNWTPPTGHN